MRDFYLQKDGQRNWVVRPKKMGQMGRSRGSDPQQHFTGWIFFHRKFLSCLKLSVPSNRVQCGRVQAVPQKSTPQHES
jgi:hypothetical protein